jgi:hypothetical protein
MPFQPESSQGLCNHVVCNTLAVCNLAATQMKLGFHDEQLFKFKSEYPFTSSCLKRFTAVLKPQPTHQPGL